MAKLEHLVVLKQGIEAWNRWRQANLSVTPDLCRADLHEANLMGAHLSGALLEEANLTGAVLTEATCNDTRFAKADLTRARCAWTDLSGADLTGAMLMGAELLGARLYRATLLRANLNGAVLHRADLNGAILTEADFHGARLTMAVLSEARLEGADFGDAVMGATLLALTDLSAAKSLDRVTHLGPSSIGIETVVASKGRIPQVFLRGAGVPELFVEYMRSLAGQAIEYYSCFISYASADQALAERLYADLQAKGVRCYYAPEHMKIGEDIGIALDQAIQRQDKVLLILSEASMASQWIDREVSAALRKERVEKRTVLFPIRVDDAMRHATAGWAAYLWSNRHTGDFRQWKDQDDYQAAFERLLADLAVGEG